MSHTLLKATNISHHFDTQLYRDINLTLEATKSAAILGRSGSGKSTFLHHCSTFLKPQNGDIILLDRHIYTLSSEHIEQIRRKELGIIFQFHYLFKGMSALENIEVSTILAGTKVDNFLLGRLGIDGDLIEQKISELSGGEQQRVSIARVLSKKPKIIFADEPTGNLDKETANLVMDVLLEYVHNNEASLLLVTHDEELAMRCDDIYRLKDQQLEHTKIS